MPAIVRTRQQMSEVSDLLTKSGESLGFVPTMGALHPGHISLVERAARENRHVVVSIFVNPIQFNNLEDLRLYPRTLEEDLRLLETTRCEYVFYPEPGEMYPDEITESYDFGSLGDVLEGKFRPGHFNGVAIVVRRLFDIVKPHRAYFGEKDFQQLAIVREMTRMLRLPVEIVPCPTLRDPDGLAMSSRNTRLTAEGRKNAVFLYQILTQTTLWAQQNSYGQIREYVIEAFRERPEFRLEYFEIADSRTLLPLSERLPGQEAVALVAAWLENVRLIDNMRLPA